MLRKDKNTDSLVIGHLNFNDWASNEESLCIEKSCCAAELLDGINELLCGMYAEESTFENHWVEDAVAFVCFSENAPVSCGCFWVLENGEVHCNGVRVGVAVEMGFYVRGFAKALASRKSYER